MLLLTGATIVEHNWFVPDMKSSVMRNFDVQQLSLPVIILTRVSFAALTKNAPVTAGVVSPIGAELTLRRHRWVRKRDRSNYYSEHK